MGPIGVCRTFGIMGRRFESYLNAALNGTGVTFPESIFLVNILAQEGINQEHLSSTLLIDKKGSNILSITSDGIPQPVSLTTGFI